MKKIFLIIAAINFIFSLGFFCGYKTSESSLDDLNSQIDNMTEKSKQYLNIIRWENKKCKEDLNHLKTEKQKIIEDLQLCYEREEKIYDCGASQEY